MPGSKLLLFQGWSSNLSCNVYKTLRNWVDDHPPLKKEPIGVWTQKAHVEIQKESNVSSKGAVGVQLMGDTQQEHPKSPLPQSSVLPKLFLPNGWGLFCGNLVWEETRKSWQFPGLAMNLSSWIHDYNRYMQKKTTSSNTTTPLFLWNIPFSNTKKKLTVLNHPVQFPQHFLLSL